MKFAVLALLVFCACTCSGKVHLVTAPVPANISFWMSYEYSETIDGEVVYSSHAIFHTAILGNSTLSEYTVQYEKFFLGKVVEKDSARRAETHRYDWRKEEEKNGEKYWVFPKFENDLDNGKCQEYRVTENDVRKEIHLLTLSIQEDKDFEYSRDTVFNGTACKMYYNVETSGETDTHYYVDANQRLIGTFYWKKDTSTNEKKERTTTIVYKDDLTPETFVLDRNIYPGCSEEAYTLGPDAASSGSQSSAVTNVASLAVVFLLVTLVLFL